jgi:hypothetical protein
VVVALREGPVVGVVFCMCVCVWVCVWGVCVCEGNTLQTASTPKNTEFSHMSLCVTDSYAGTRSFLTISG